MAQSPLESSALKIGELYEATQQRETFLNVSETDYHFLFHAILFVKCLIAGCGAKRFVPHCATALLLWFNLLNSILIDNGFDNIYYNVSFFVAMCIADVVFSDYRFPFLLSAMGWYVATWDTNFYFCLDVYVVVSLLAFIYRAHENNSGDGWMVIFCLFFVTWVGDLFIDSMDLGKSLVMLYFPVMIGSSFIPFNRKLLRLVCIFTAGFMWLCYQFLLYGFLNPVTYYAADTDEFTTTDNFKLMEP